MTKAHIADGGSVAENLLAWYDRNKRELPWRGTSDAYAIWISEIMLQQTRVETALPFYRAFLERFPSLEDLAAAELDEVLGRWSGLGYYGRARNLHRAARQLAADTGRLPERVEDLLQLPGVGPYTAAAIASIAFGQAVAVVDGNVERVMARYRAIAGDPRRGAARQAVARAARELLDDSRPGDSNQALMELGATVCLPRAPRCSSCPLAPGCRARAAGEPTAYPAPRRRSRAVQVERLVAVVRDHERILLMRRGSHQRQLSGLWELPWIEPDGADSGERAARFAQRYGGSWRLGRSLGRIRHTITNRTFRVEVLAAELGRAGDLAEGREARWFDRQEIDQLPKSSLVRKALVRASGASE